MHYIYIYDSWNYCDNCFAVVQLKITEEEINIDKDEKKTL